MNERIAKLANQSGFDVDTTGTFGNYSEMHRLDKFAELIVRECIDIIDMTHGSKKLMRPDPYQKIIWAIEQHFGVEE